MMDGLQAAGDPVGADKSSAEQEKKDDTRLFAKKARAVASKLGLVVGSLAISFVIAEFVLRHYQKNLIDDQKRALGIQAGAVLESEIWQRWQPDGNGQFHIKSDNPTLVYENRPNAHVVIARRDRNQTVETNSAGLRDREFSKERRARTIRIAIVGDSVTIGLYFDPQRTYPKVLER